MRSNLKVPECITKCVLANICSNSFSHCTVEQKKTVAISQMLLLCSHSHNDARGWSGGAMVLGKLPVPRRPTIWITVGQGPTALAVGAGGGCLDIFTLIYPFFPLSPSLWETARYRLKFCLKGPLNPKPTYQPIITTFSPPHPHSPEPQRNVSMAAVRSAVRPSIISQMFNHVK